jgi:threonine/homoserine/homoserine lactone efflux protein
MKEGNKLSAKAIYGIVMVLFYVCIAILVVFTSVFKDFMPNDIIRVIIGVLFFAYGLFRAYRVWKGV